MSEVKDKIYVGSGKEKFDGDQVAILFACQIFQKIGFLSTTTKSM